MSGHFTTGGCNTIIYAVLIFAFIQAKNGLLAARFTFVVTDL